MFETADFSSFALDFQKTTFLHYQEIALLFFLRVALIVVNDSFVLRTWNKLSVLNVLSYRTLRH